MAAPYIRKMVILQEEAPGYRQEPSRPCAGRALAEVCGSKGKITVSAQNLRGGVTYMVYLIEPGEMESVGIPIGRVTANERGRVDARLLFDAGENGSRLNDKTIVTLIVPSAGTLTAPLVGMVNPAAPSFVWRGNFKEYTFPEKPCGCPSGAGAEMPEPETLPVPPMETLPAPEPESRPESEPKLVPEPMPMPEPAPEPEPVPIPPMQTLPEPEPVPVPPMQILPEPEPEPTPAPEALPETVSAKEVFFGFVQEDGQAQEQDPHERFAEVVAAFRRSEEAFIPSPEAMAQADNDGATEEAGRQEPDIWMLFETNTPMSPFEKQNADVRWVRLSIEELAQLPMGGRRLAESEFVKNGYEHYRHLLLGKLSQGIMTRFILGVPGIYKESEHRMAARLGFRQFKTLDGSPPAAGTPGYWLLVL